MNTVVHFWYLPETDEGGCSEVPSQNDLESALFDTLLECVFLRKLRFTYTRYLAGVKTASQVQDL